MTSLFFSSQPEACVRKIFHTFVIDFWRLILFTMVYMRKAFGNFRLLPHVQHFVYAAALKPYLCGGSSACFASFCIHPIDVTKVRLQV